MNTFLPYADFNRSAQVLDRQRLGKQRVEVLQLVHATVLEKLNVKTRTAAHPACKMWNGHLFQLIEYGKAICDEWHIMRGYEDTVRDQLVKFEGVEFDTGMPYWFGDPNFHSSMRGRLLEKDPEFYSQYCWKDAPCGSIEWPQGVSA